MKFLNVLLIYSNVARRSFKYWTLKLNMEKEVEKAVPADVFGHGFGAISY